MDYSVGGDSRIAKLPRVLRPPAIAARAVRSAYARCRNPPTPPTYEYVFQSDGLATEHFSPFLFDPQYSRTYDEIKAECWPGVWLDLRWRLWVLTTMARRAHSLPGDFAEFGTYRGGCAYMVLSTLPPMAA